MPTEPPNPYIDPALVGISLGEAQSELRECHRITEDARTSEFDRAMASRRAGDWIRYITTLLPKEPGWYWLSFADPDKPKGEQFLGVAVVRGENFGDACLHAHRLGVNPRGEVRGYRLPQPPRAGLCERLLDKNTLTAEGLI